VLARSIDEVGETVERIEKCGGEALGVPADVSSADQVGAALAKIEERWGPVEILINNAAVVSPIGPSVEIDPSEWETAIRINLVALACLNFSVLSGMLEARWGRIVNVSSSIAAHPAGMVRANAYATSKAAVEAHTLNLAAEVATTGITVNAYRPGSVDTAMQAWVRDQNPYRVGTDLHRRFVSSHEEGSLLTPAESASSLLTHLRSTETGKIWSAVRS
jgi:3-oxoacyl-[acyl-carrier protein] reductase